MAAFELLLDGDAWMIYYNTKTGGLHWDFVSRPNPTISTSNLRVFEER